MTSTKRIGHATALGVAMLIGGGVSAPCSWAAYTVPLVQQGANVVAAGSGSIDTQGLSFHGHSGAVAAITPSSGTILTGPIGGEAPQAVDTYTGFTGPMSFGSGPAILASSGSGNIAGLQGVDLGRVLAVPLGYVSDSPLSATATYNNATFTTLGATPGTYVWTWGSGADADSFTLQIGPAAVPEPASLMLLAVGLAGLGMVLRTRRA